MVYIKSTIIKMLYDDKHNIKKCCPFGLSARILTFLKNFHQCIFFVSNFPIYN
jgi:hypothetical protein